MIDYSISWAYITARMESLYGISADNDEKFAFGDIQRRLDYIWQEFFEMQYAAEHVEDKECVD